MHYGLGSFTANPIDRFVIGFVIRLIGQLVVTLP